MPKRKDNRLPQDENVIEMKRMRHDARRQRIQTIIEIIRFLIEQNADLPAVHLFRIIEQTGDYDPDEIVAAFAEFGIPLDDIV
jgi:hypothetical protein